ncbi:DUF1707 domain-containing protein [Agromyces sp. Soil535]|uniref:DUF1707 domain-containing protein n=1 Tax=Agromyces sp. Soil535 TaxID=1736390 RepID=UPI0019109914|nr:DUF1707 domain-containing protein [Agromyces sp. Soil535]
MTSSYANPDRPAERLSNAERDDAVANLAAAQAEGRLTPAEYTDRAAAARTAVTRGDLVPLFADLPETQQRTGGTAPQMGADPTVVPDFWYRAPAPSSGGSRALGGWVGDTIMALTPFIALGLFLLFGFQGSFVWSWLWFLVIPVAAIIIYVPGRPPNGARTSGALGGRIGDTIMALTPFLAIGLFFLTGFLSGFIWAWLWFLIIPIAGIIIYGPGANDRRSRR